MDHPSSTPERTSYYRWMVCFLLFLASTINYMDRQVIAILKPDLQKELGWSEINFGNIITAFSIAYALGLLFTGRLIDRIGVRWGLGLAVFFWSLAAMGHGLMVFLKDFSPIEIGMGGYIVWVAPATVLGFCFARFALGLSEGGNFPASIKAVSEWYPKKERALATGLFNSGTNVGALLTPLLIPVLYAWYGWPIAFYVTGGLGFLWLILWFMIYDSPERHPRVSPKEMELIRSDPIEPAVKIPWVQLLGYRATWGFLLAKFLTDPIWWFYLYWVPDFLNKRHGLDILSFGPPLVTIYLMTDVGSIGGGWLSSHLIKRGWSINVGRKFAMLVCALCVVPIIAASQVDSLWVAVLLIGLAASAHQGFSANLFTIASDTMPRHTVSSVVGIGGMAGAVGGVFFAQLAGHVLQWTGSFYWLFAIASTVYLVALLVLQILIPRLEQQ